jgi:hypothetical protein
LSSTASRRPPPATNDVYDFVITIAAGHHVIDEIAAMIRSAIAAG